jgi:hypothetical protein
MPFDIPGIYAAEKPGMKSTNVGQPGETEMRKTSSALGLATFCIALAGMASASDEGIDIASSKSTPAGQTYGHWAAEWWQWRLGIPEAKSPVNDTTGQYCTQRQVGDVWFLAGSNSDSGPIVRNCEIPAGKSLYFPLINGGYAAYLSDPPETRTEQFMRDAARCTEPAQISLQIDGSKIPKERLTFTGPSGSQSPLFNVQLTADNVFGADQSVIPELLLSPTAEQGYYVFLYPLRPGTHTLAWTASGCHPGAFQDITYHLTVVGTPRH